MAISQEQKVDFLLKKIGFTAAKTGNATDATGLSGTLTPKAGFGEAIPSPLIIANSSLWNEADSIPATPPGSDTTQVKVYAPAGALRMTVDSTVANNRSFIAYTTYNDTTSARLTNWIDTQFGPDYIIKVFVNDATVSDNKLNAGGSGNNDGWFFDYSAGVLNFNDTNVPSDVVDGDPVYIVGYRYVGQTGAPTSGISTFSFLDLTVERNLDVGIQGGISTFRNNIDANGIIEGIAGENKIPSLYANLAALPSASTYHGMFAHVHSTGRGYFAHAGNWLELVNKDTSGNVGLSGDLDVDGHTNLDNISVAGVSTFTGDATFSGNVSIGGTLTYEDVTNVDSVGLLTARSGIRVTGGVIEALAGENKIPSLYANMAALPSPSTYHGMFAHVHSTGRGYFAHGGAWYELVNADLTGRVGTGTESYFIDRLVSTSTTATSLNVTGVTTAVTVDINGDLDVDGHTNLDNVSIAGVTTITQDLDVDGHTFLDNVSVAGVTTFSDDVTFTTASGNNIVFDKSDNQLEFGNDVKAEFGASGQLELNFESNSGNSVIKHTANAGYLVLHSDNFDLRPKSNGGHVYLRANYNDGVDLYFANSKKFETTNTGITVTGTVVATGADINGDLDVDGHTNLDNVSISGVTTFAGNVDINADIDVDGHTNLDNVSIVGVTTHQGHVLPSADVAYDLGSSSKQWRNLYADNIVSAPGIGFIGPDLTVRNFKATGISTFDGTTRFNGRIAVNDGTTGTNGQYLKSVGTGVTWASFPTLRSRDTIVASAGQTSFTFNYNVNFIDVFVNGIKLTDSEFTATNGTSVTLAVGCFVGDIVELVSYSTISSGGGGGGGTLNNIVEDTSPQLGGNLDLFNKTINGTGGINITGVVTATTFIGDGSGLTGITASGTGVVIKNNDSTVGTAGTINFGDDLSVTPIVAGIVTVGIDTSQINLNKLNVSGISTFNDDIDINANIDVSGNSILQGDLNVDGHTNLDNVSVSGVVTATTFVGAVTGNATGLSGTPNISVGTISGSTGTFSGAIDANGDLDVDGHTELDNVNIAGVVTATTFKGALEATSGSFSSNVNVGTGISITPNGDTSFSGITTIGGVTHKTVGSIDQILSTGSSGFFIKTHNNGLKIQQNAYPNNTYASFSNGGASFYVNGNSSLVNHSGSWDFYQHISANQDNKYDIGTAFSKFRQIHATNINAGVVTATSFVGDGSGLTNVSAAGISTTNLRADTIVVGENTTGVSTFHRVQIPTNKVLYFGDSLASYITYPTSGYLDIYGGTTGDLNIRTGGNQDVHIEPSGSFLVKTNGTETAIRAAQNGSVELYNNNSSSSSDLRFRTTGVGASVIGITSMTDNLMVGTAATITPAGAAHFAGIVTATSFIGDGSGLTGITASGSGIIIKEGGTTVGTAGTINFVGVDVSPASAGIVTVSTATTSITDGNSKLFVNNVSSSNGNGSFEVFLNEFTSNGTAEALNMHQPSDGYARIDLFHGSTPQTIEVNAKTVYSGYARHRLKFETTNSSYGGQLDFLGSSGSWNFYSTYQGQQKNVISFNYNTIGVGDDLYPTTNNAFDLGFSNYKFRQFHVTGVNAGVVTATTYHGDGSNLTGISGSQNVFQTVAVSGQSNVVADSTTDTLTLVAGSNMTITTNASSDTITFAASGGSGGVTVQDEGSSLSTTATTLNFVGDNVVATGGGATKTITIEPTTSDIQVVYEITSQSSFSYFRFAGNGVDSSANNPDIYLTRGQKYRFINNSGGSHPFQIQTTASSAYTTGVTYPSGTSATSGNIDFAVRWDAPSQLKYVCLSHGSMVGNIYISGGESGRRTTANAATSSLLNNQAGNISITAAKTYSLLKVQTSAAAWVTLYTDSTSRSNDASRGETTDPTPGSGVIAEVITSGAATQILSPGVIGWNNDSTPAPTVYAKVVNKSGSTQAITVTLHYLAMEI